MNLPESAVVRDYYIVLALDNLYKSDYVNVCVFKGGTSLSKCYQNSIERFSEDIDLTFLGMEMSDKECDKNLKRIESTISRGFEIEKINSERSNRSKSSLLWFEDKKYKIKLEIGSSVRPDPYSEKEIKSYIHEYLEQANLFDNIKKYELYSVKLNVLNVERTFVDKIMSIKRHACAGTLVSKVRHIYDVTRLYSLKEVQDFISNKKELKRLVVLTKETDSYYLNQKNIKIEYNPCEKYEFEKWRDRIRQDVKNEYENLHKTLLYTNVKQEYNEAEKILLNISKILSDIDE